MPISRKRFSKKRTTKKSVKKNTRKHKKRTPRRKYKKSSKRLRFFGGFGEDEDCAICTEPLTPETTFKTNCQHNFHRACIEQWCNGKAVCPCPLCKTSLIPNPNPNPVLPPPPPVVVDNYGLFRVEFFTFVNNPQTGEIDRVPVSIIDMSDLDLNTLIDYFVEQNPGSDEDNFLFFGNYQGTDPDGYIQIQSYQPNLVINEGDIDIHTNPPTIVQSARITRVPNFERLPTTTPNPTVIGTPVELPENSYRVEFFRTDGENNRVPVRVQDIPHRERSDIIAYLVTEFDDLGFYNIRFNGEHEDNPYGYIVLGDNPYNVRIREGDIFHTFLFNDPEHVPNVTSLRITRM